VTNEETRALVEMISRENSLNRQMAQVLIDHSIKNLDKLLNIMVDRRLCKLDAAQEALTEDGKPKFSVELCQAGANRRDWCATHNRSIWECVKEMTERLA
jgi:hypothetical protein